MANINILTYGVNNQKKVRSVSSAVLAPAYLTSKNSNIITDGQLAANDVVSVLKLPASCVVTGGYIVALSAAAEATATLQVKVGGTSVIDAIAVGNTAGAVLGTFSSKVFTGTGADVTVVVGTATLKSGEFAVVLEYDEIERNAFGDYTPVI